MATFLFEDIIFGPVSSRRLGASLGINLLPGNRKICNFNCIYCECGWTDESQAEKSNLPSRDEVRVHLEKKLKTMLEAGDALDTITFAGNGEPTLHPDFEGIIEDTLQLRERLCPNVKVAVLSNATRLGNPVIFRALQRIDQPILKLDSALPETIGILNRPAGGYDPEKILDQLAQFQGKFILQTLFVEGTHNGVIVDNSSIREIESWLNAVQFLQPEQVMIYTIARDTPLETLRKIAPQKLDQIAQEVRKLGIQVSVSY